MRREDTECRETILFKIIRDAAREAGESYQKPDRIKAVLLRMMENLFFTCEGKQCRNVEEDVHADESVYASPEAASARVWRVGILTVMLVTQEATLDPRSYPMLSRLVGMAVPEPDGVNSWNEPRQELVMKLLTAAKQQKRPEQLEKMSKLFLESLGTETGSPVPGGSAVMEFGHPVDSGIVKILETTMVSHPFRKLVDLNADSTFGQMMASGIPVTEENCPELNRIVEDCVRILKIRRPYVIITNRVSGINAITFGSDESPCIAVSSLMLRLFKPEQMRFVIGHECGHIAMGHVVCHTAVSVLGSFMRVIPVVGKTVSSSLALPLNAWSRRSEITADRSGLLCCGSLDTAQRTLLQLESAYIDADAVDLEQYVGESRRYLARGFLRRAGEFSSSHPLTYKRIEALKVFAESEAYRNAAGKEKAPGLLNREQLDRRTEDILCVL